MAAIACKAASSSVLGIGRTLGDNRSTFQVVVSIWSPEHVPVGRNRQALAVEGVVAA